MDNGARRSWRGAALAGARAADQWWERATSPTVSRGGDDGEPRWLDQELAHGMALAAERDTVSGAESEGFRKRRIYPCRIYPYGVSWVRLEQVIRELGLPAVVSRDERDADALLVLKSVYR